MTRHTGEKTATKTGLEERPQFNTNGEPSFESLVTIGETAFTKVFKTIRNSTAVAVKVCRKPDSKQSADTWRNELNILTQLDHVGQIFELTLTELTIQ